MSVGPFRIEVVEPMRKTRWCWKIIPAELNVILCFQLVLYRFRRRGRLYGLVLVGLWMPKRFDQFGRWQGTISHPDGDLLIDDSECLATKDRSWGVRAVGEPETGGAPNAGGGIFFLWGATFLGFIISVTPSFLMGQMANRWFVRVLQHLCIGRKLRFSRITVNP
ncbi:MAG: hypothetical protein Ct9H90mP27_7030 [Gammaproteobacteria bacterium]|nr:MAG: hypothetical protein Ct9H90mP27_7030 [Gammaproteobacteria bacterium]